MGTLADTVGPLPRPPVSSHTNTNTHPHHPPTLSPLGPDGTFDLGSLPRVYSRTAAFKSPSPVSVLRLGNEEKKGKTRVGDPTREGDLGAGVAIGAHSHTTIPTSVSAPPTPNPTYAPPQKPLSPHQLRRIAQSFGIVVPSLPSSPHTASPTATSSRVKLDSYSRSSTHLLAVIPPLALCPPDEEAHKWRRGRLIPLQSTYGGMLAAIAREYGLPSTSGLSVFLQNTLTGAQSAQSHGDDTTDGPLVSSSAWTTMFGHHIHHPRSSPSTPVKGKGSFPPSPLFLVDGFNGPTRPTLEIPLSAPIDTSSPIVGSIGFDVEPTVPWLADWRRAGRYRRASSLSDRDGSNTSIRQLRLPKRVQDQKSPRFLREREREGDVESDRAEKRSSEDTSSDGMVSGDTTLHDDEYDYQRSLAGTRSQSRTRRLDSDVPQIRLHGRELSSTTIASIPVAKEDLLASPINLSLGDRVDSLELSESDKELLKAELAKRGSALVMSEQLDDLEKLMRQLSPKEIRLTSPRVLTPRTAAKISVDFPVNPKAKTLEPPNNTTGRNANAHGNGGASLTVNTSPAPSPAFDAATLSRPPIEAAYDDLVRPQWPAVPLGSPGSPTSVHEYFRPAERDRDRERGSTPTSVSEETVRRMREPLTPPSPPQLSDTQSPHWRPARPQRPPSPDLSHFRPGHASRPSHTLSPELVDHLQQQQQIQNPTRSPGTPEMDREKKKRSGSISLKGLRHMSSRGFGKYREKDRPPALPLGQTSSQSIGNIREDGEGQMGMGVMRSSVSSGSNLVGGVGSGDVMASTTATGLGVLDEDRERHTNTNANTIANANSNGNSSKGFGRLFGFGNRKSDRADKDRDRESKYSTSGTGSSSAGLGLGLGLGHARGRSSDTTGTAYTATTATTVTTANSHPVHGQRSISSPMASTLQRTGGMSQAQSQAHSHSHNHTRTGSDLGRSSTLGGARADIAGAGIGEFGTNILTPTPVSPASPRSVKRKPVPGVGGSGNGHGQGRTSEERESGMRHSESIGSMGSMASVTREALGMEGRLGLGIGMGMGSGMGVGKGSGAGANGGGGGR